MLFASAALIILFSLWRPIGGMVWDVANPPAQAILWALFLAGWGIVLLSTFLINHFELFGLQQAWLHLRNREPAKPVFHQPLFYKWVRHPLYLGFFLAFWATPHMTYGHLLLSVGLVDLHADRDPLRGARPGRPVRRPICPVPRRVGMLIPGVPAGAP